MFAAPGASIDLVGGELHQQRPCASGLRMALQSIKQLGWHVDRSAVNEHRVSMCAVTSCICLTALRIVRTVVLCAVLQDTCLADIPQICNLLKTEPKYKVSKLEQKPPGLKQDKMHAMPASSSSANGVGES